MPVDIVAIIAEEVDLLTSDPAFSHGDEAWNNLILDGTDIYNGFVHLDEPIISDDVAEISGAYTENFSIEMLFGKKVESTQMFDFDKHHAVAIEMRAVRFEFINRIKARPEIFNISNIKTVEVINLYDENISGVILYFTAKCTSGDPICPPGDEPLAVVLQGTNLACYGYPTGAIVSEVVGGVGEYTYLWDDPLESTTPDLSNLDAGTYTLIVTDEAGTQVTAEITITQPAAIVLTPSFENVTTHGGSDGEASVVASGGTAPYTYLWDPGEETTAGITGLTAGAYSVVVTDANGCIANYLFTIGEPANLLPESDAGANASIELPTDEALLEGGGTDADGTITGYLWTQISGPNTATIVTPTTASTTVSGLIEGTYIFQLQVTDNFGGTAVDSATVTVSPADVNILPEADAGANETITLPDDTATLSGGGTDADGTIVGYLWTKISGPTGGTITTPAAASTGITDLEEGDYIFQLAVTDNDGGVGTDTVTITVEAEQFLSNINVESTDVDLEYKLNSVHDEELGAKAGDNSPRDRFAEPMASNLYAMLAKARVAIGHSDSHEHHYIVGLGEQHNGTRFTFTIMCSELPDGHPNYDPAAILKGLSCAAGLSDFFQDTLDMAAQEDSQVMIPANANLDAAECAAELLIALDKYDASRVAASLAPDPKPIIIGGMEFDTNGYENQQKFPNGSVDYAAKMQTVMDTVWAVRPTVEFIINSRNVHKDSSEDWNAPLVATFNWGAHTPIAMLYDRSEHFIKHLDETPSYNPVPPASFDDAQWLSSMLDGLLVTFPSHIEKFKTDFPGYKLSIISAGLSGGGPDALNDYGTTNSFLGYAMQMHVIMVRHANEPTLIHSAAWYKPTSVHKAIPRNDWWAHLAFAELFRNPGAKMCIVTTTIPGVYITGVKVGSEYTLHLVNTSGFDVAVPDINFDGTILTGFTGTMYYGTARNSTTVLTEAFAGTLRKLSVSFLKKTVV